MSESIESIMWQYIGEEQTALRRLEASSQVDAYVRRMGAEKLKSVYFVAHGSSRNAAVAALPFFSEFAEVRAYACTPAAFPVTKSASLLEERGTALIVLISQTGTSSGVLEALSFAKAQGLPTLAVTAARNSPVCVKSDDALLLMCGEEKSNAKTKGYSATLLLLLQLALALGRARHTLSPDRERLCREELSGMIGLLPEIREQALEFCRRNDFGRGMRDLYVLTDGINIGTAQEAQLKLMETMCIPTVFSDFAEFSHGMHRSVDSHSYILFLKTPASDGGQVEKMCAYLRAVCGNVYVIDVGGSREDTRQDTRRLSLPVFPLTRSLLLLTLAIQVLSVYAPENNGRDPNRDSHDDFTVLAGTRVS